MILICLSSVVMKISKIEKKENYMCKNKVKTIKKKGKVKFINIFLIISLPHLPLN